MHESFFSYTITKPYPYRSFTPTVLVGGVILLVLLSITNFVQNSYTLVVEYADDPNSTISNGVWFEGWPSYLTSSVRPTCQPANLAVNTQFFTNQTALTWTILDIWKAKRDTSLSVKSDDLIWSPLPTKDASDALPSVPYMNNPLEDCHIWEIQMLFDNTQDQPLPFGGQYLQVTAFVTCGIWGPFGYSMINLEAVFATKTISSLPGTTGFASRNITSRSSAYWAEALLSAYLFQTSQQMLQVANTTTPTLAKGVAILYPGQSQAISSLDFFDLKYIFTSPTLSSLGAGHQAHIFDNWQNQQHSIRYYIGLGNSSVATPQIWQPADNLGKAMYSAILTDLGQTQSAPSNILANPETLQMFSSNFSNIAHEFSYIKSAPMVETQSYNERQAGKNPTGPLEITPSVISTNYICQVPKKKPPGDIFISVLLADLVLLQAAWKLYTFAVTQLLLRKQSQAMHCEGCASGEGSEDEKIEKCSIFSKFSRNGSKVASSVSSLEKGGGRECLTVKERIRRFVRFIKSEQLLRLESLFAFVGRK